MGGAPAPATLRPVLRLLLVDDHHILTQLLEEAVAGQPDLLCVAVAHDVASALETVSRLRPDVVVMDVKLGDGDGAAAARDVIAVSPGTRVVVLTGHADLATVQRAARSGASAVLSKDGGVDVLFEAIRTATPERLVIGPGLPALPAPPGGGQDPARTLGLRADDAVLLRLVAAGYDQATLARELGRSTGEVQSDVARIMSTLGARSPMEAVSIAVRAGAVRLGEDDD